MKNRMVKFFTAKLTVASMLCISLLHPSQLYAKQDKFQTTVASEVNLNIQSNPFPPNIAGGVQFLKSPSIAIQRQDIHISVDQVTVNYIFINNSALDLIQTMVFTIPSSNYDKLYNQNEEQLQRYTVTANGRNIDYKTIVRPISFTGEDLHTFFSSLGISANPIEAMTQINGEYNSYAAAKRALHQRGLIDPNTNTAKWFTQTYYYWQQKFPPAEEVQIQQNYKPNISIHRNLPHPRPRIETTRSILSWGNKNKRDDAKQEVENSAQQAALQKIIDEFESDSAQYTAYLSQYCPTNNDYAVLMQKFSHPKEQSKKLISRELNFNLTADHNWSSPIEHFTLKIEQPKNTMALLCWPEQMQRINSTTLIYEARNYAPPRDVRLLLVNL